MDQFTEWNKSSNLVQEDIDNLSYTMSTKEIEYVAKTAKTLATMAVQAQTGSLSDFTTHLEK